MTYAVIAMPFTLIMPDLWHGFTRLMPRYSNRKVGGIRFVKVGRINFSFSVSKK